MTDEERPVCSEALLGYMERGCEALGGSDIKKAAAEIRALRALRAELVECRERTLREAARAVCGYCSGRFPSFARKAIGPNAAGNYIHTRKDVSDVVLCVASSIYSLIAYEAAVSARAAKEAT